jgi:DNA-binding response OmpR family regulator
MRSSSPPKFKKSVLVVEDDKAVRDMIVRALSSRYRVHEAPDGFAASELLGTIQPPDLVVCDIMMPKVDGFSLVRMLRASPMLRHTHVIFLTAKTAPQAVIAGIKLGAKHYVHKPFSVSELVDKISKLLA